MPKTLPLGSHLGLVGCQWVRASYFVGRWACNSLATMHANNLLTVVALAASILLVLKVPSRLFPVIALVASAIEVLRAFGILSLKVPVIGAALLFGGAMVVGGVGSWIKSSGKVAVTAAVLVASWV